MGAAVCQRWGLRVNIVIHEIHDRRGKAGLTGQSAELAGQVRPTRLVMEDALKQGEVSILTYDGMALRDLPERMFTREYLRRLQ